MELEGEPGTRPHRQEVALGAEDLVGALGEMVHHVLDVMVQQIEGRRCRVLEEAFEAGHLGLRPGRLLLRTAAAPFLVRSGVGDGVGRGCLPSGGAGQGLGQCGAGGPELPGERLGIAGVGPGVHRCGRASGSCRCGRMVPVRPRVVEMSRGGDPACHRPCGFGPGAGAVLGVLVPAERGVVVEGVEQVVCGVIESERVVDRLVERLVDRLVERLVGGVGGVGGPDGASGGEPDRGTGARFGIASVRDPVECHGTSVTVTSDGPATGAPVPAAGAARIVGRGGLGRVGIGAVGVEFAGALLDHRAGARRHAGGADRLPCEDVTTESATPRRTLVFRHLGGSSAEQHGQPGQ